MIQLKNIKSIRWHGRKNKFQIVINNLIHFILVTNKTYKLHVTDTYIYKKQKKKHGEETVFKHQDPGDSWKEREKK